MSIEEFLEKAHRKHGDKYDYSLIKEITQRVPIICKRHGMFEQDISSHLRGYGCLLCKRKALTYAEMCSSAIQVHGMKYDYSLNDNTQFYYKDKKIKISCQEHGVFEQQLGKHLDRKQGCPKCSINFSGFNESTLNKRLSELYGDLYSVSTFSKGSHSKQTFHCSKHNIQFVRIANDILHNSLKCPVCIQEEVDEKQKITCPEHGIFEQTPEKHLSGQGCPSCNTSKFELDVFNFVKSLEFIPIKNNRTLLSGYELDLYIEDLNVAIECNGIYWHSSKFKNKNYHRDKFIEAKKKAIKLLQFDELQWLNKNDICKSIISANLKCFKERVFARKTIVKTISDKTQLKYFLTKNHLQGYIHSKFNYGLYLNDELLSVMTFGKPRFSKGHEFEMLRFCTKLNTHVVGGASKLLKAFINATNCKSLLTYANANISNGTVYKTLGFKYLEHTKPNYFWFTQVTSLSRYQTTKEKLKSFLDVYDDKKTEKENMEINGYLQYHDAGNLKYELKL